MFKFLSWSAIEKREFFITIGYLIFAKYQVYCRPFKHLQLGIALPASTYASKTAQLDDINKIALVKKSLARANRLMPWRKTRCLVKAIAGKRRLRAYGINSCLYIGTQKDKNKIKSHAWLNCGTITVSGGLERPNFTPTVVYE